MHSVYLTTFAVLLSCDNMGLGTMSRAKLQKESSNINPSATSESPNCLEKPANPDESWSKICSQDTIQNKASENTGAEFRTPKFDVISVCQQMKPTIEKGIYGCAFTVSGDCIPSPESRSNRKLTCGHFESFKGKIIIATNIVFDTIDGKPSFAAHEKAASYKIVHELQASESGFFEIPLEDGVYAILSDVDQIYCNGNDVGAGKKPCKSIMTSGDIHNDGDSTTLKLDSKPLEFLYLDDQRKR